MHSGINTYIPRGITSLERRLSEDDIKRLNIEAPLKMIKEGLKHTQKVYKGVYGSSLLKSVPGTTYNLSVIFGVSFLKFNNLLHNFNKLTFFMSVTVTSNNSLALSQICLLAIIKSEVA